MNLIQWNSLKSAILDASNFNWNNKNIAAATKLNYGWDKWAEQFSSLADELISVRRSN